MTENKLERCCFLCDRVLTYRDFINHNSLFSPYPIEFLENAWKNSVVKLICCGCYRIVMHLKTAEATVLLKTEEKLIMRDITGLKREWSVEKFKTVLEMVKNEF